MSLLAIVQDRLTSHTPLTDIVQSKIYQDIGEEGTTIPLIVHGASQITRDPELLSGVVTIVWIDYQVEAWHLNAQMANGLADIIIGRLDQWSEGQVKQCTWKTQSNEYDENGYKRTLTFRIVYERDS